MTYICEDCGNEDDFKGYQDLKEWHTERIYFNKYGDIDEWGDSETTDSEVTDGPYEIECEYCGSSNVRWEDDEEERKRIKKNAKPEEEKKILNWEEEVNEIQNRR